MHLEGRKEGKEKEETKKGKLIEEEAGKKKLAVIIQFSRYSSTSSQAFLNMGNSTGDYQTQETRHNFCRLKSL